MFKNRSITVFTICLSSAIGLNPASAGDSGVAVKDTSSGLVLKGESPNGEASPLLGSPAPLLDCPVWRGVIGAAGVGEIFKLCV